ncbi:MAG: tetratricopeptide repeat protein [Anaerolineales bacterium]|nr:MAG: tetratricopeptide repeat protein [Anaerolineales bacterium]
MTGREELFQRLMDQGHTAAWDQNWDQAAGFYSQALEEHPENFTALTSLGLALFELHRYEESLRCYVQAAKLAPNDPLPLEKLAHIYKKLGNDKFAQAAATRAAEVYLKNQDVNKALENWRFVAVTNPANFQAHTRLAQIYERLGQKEEAVIEYLAVASLLQKGNDNERAVQAANYALRIYPGSAEALQALTALGEFKPLPMPELYRSKPTSAQVAESSELTTPANSEMTTEESDPITEARQKALSTLAGILFEATEEEEETSEGRPGFSSIVRGTGKLMSANLDRSRTVLHVSQVIDLQTRGDVAQAAQELEKAIQAGLDHSAAYFDLGLLKYLNGDLEEALRHLRNASQNPEFALGARLVSGQALQKSGKYKEASLEFLGALRLAEMEAIPETQWNELYQQYDPLIEAQRQEADPQIHKQVSENIASLLVQPGWRNNMIKSRSELPMHEGDERLIPLAELIIQAGSSRIVEIVSRISALERAGHLRTAMEEAYFALDIAPTYLPLHMQMAGLLLSQGQVQEAIEKLLIVANSYKLRGELSRAIDIYHQVIKLTPFDLAPRNSLIQLLISHGQVEEAVEESLHIAEVYYNLADLEKARETYIEAYNLAQQVNIDRLQRVNILHQIADVDLQSLDWRQAIQVYEQIRTIRPDDEKARYRLVELNARLGQEQKSIEEIDNYLSYLVKSGSKERMTAFLEGLARDYPERMAIRQRLANFYKQQGRLSDAISELDAMGELLVESGKVSEAVKIIEAILALNPPKANDYQTLLEQLRRGI